MLTGVIVAASAQLADLSAQLEDTNAIPRLLSDEVFPLASAEGGPEESRSGGGGGDGCCR